MTQLNINKYYFDGKYPQLPISMAVSVSPSKNCLKELAICYERSLATLRLQNTITILNNSESGTESDPKNADIIAVTYNPE